MTEPRQCILTVNAGSSSLRLALFPLHDSADALLRIRVEALGTADGPRCRMEPEQTASLTDSLLDGVRDHEQALGVLLDWVEARGDLRVAAVGHRLVHGGERVAPVLIDETVVAELEGLVPLAPLHQGLALKGMRTLVARRPDLPQVACFDTAFHSTLPDTARLLPLAGGGADLGARRYGFHGLSFEHAARVMGERAPGARRVVMAHLGAGASVCALRDGRSRETSMGMTPLDGLPMATRCGSLDPGVLLWLLNVHGHDGASLEELLYRHSGLMGISGISGDMRTLLESDQRAARQAVDYFVYQCARQILAMTVALGGLDAIVFTGAIGENSALIRARVLALCPWPGLMLDARANDAGADVISSPESAVSLHRIVTDEEAVIAGHARAALR